MPTDRGVDEWMRVEEDVRIVGRKGGTITYTSIYVNGSGSNPLVVARKFSLCDRKGLVQEIL